MLRLCFARAAPMAVLTSFSSSGGGSTAGVPSDSIRAHEPNPWCGSSARPLPPRLPRGPACGGPCLLSPVVFFPQRADQLPQLEWSLSSASTTHSAATSCPSVGICTASAVFMDMTKRLRLPLKDLASRRHGLEGRGRRPRAPAASLPRDCASGRDTCSHSLRRSSFSAHATACSYTRIPPRSVSSDWYSSSSIRSRSMSPLPLRPRDRPTD